MKPGPVIYLPESTVGIQLKTTQIQDYNNYIRVKAPSQNVNLRETGKVDSPKKLLPNDIMQNMLRLSKQVIQSEVDQNMLGYADGYKATQKRQFQQILINLDFEQTTIMEFQTRLKYYHLIMRRNCSIFYQNHKSHHSTVEEMMMFKKIILI